MSRFIADVGAEGFSTSSNDATSLQLLLSLTFHDWKKLIYSCRLGTSYFTLLRGNITLLRGNITLSGSMTMNLCRKCKRYSHLKQYGQSSVQSIKQLSQAYEQLPTVSLKILMLCSLTAKIKFINISFYSGIYWASRILFPDLLTCFNCIWQKNRD